MMAAPGAAQHDDADTGAPLAVTEDGLHRGLTERQLTMIAIGSAIGVGLFLGSTFTISLAGPGVIITYLIGAASRLMMGYALAEMAVVHPLAGSFGVYAELYLSPWPVSSFARRMDSSRSWPSARRSPRSRSICVLVSRTSRRGSGSRSPRWRCSSINMSSVRRFGEFEYWFALIKVVAILAFIAAGLGIVIGFGPAPAVGFDNLFNGPGGFVPHGWTGVWLALTLVITSYMGVEVIAVTAGEAQNPAQSIPRAMRTMVLRLIIFYLLAISVMLMMTPWNQIAGAAAASPAARSFAPSRPSAFPTRQA